MNRDQLRQRAEVTHEQTRTGSGVRSALASREVCLHRHDHRLLISVTSLSHMYYIPRAVLGRE